MFIGSVCINGPISKILRIAQRARICAAIKAPDIDAVSATPVKKIVLPTITKVCALPNGHASRGAAIIAVLRRQYCNKKVYEE